MDIVKNAPILLIFGVWKRLKKNINHTKYEQNRSIFDEVPKIWTQVQIFKNRPIWLKFGVSNSFLELISHTKYEQNRSIFDDVQNFGPNYFDDTEKLGPKFLICYYEKANLP